MLSSSPAWGIQLSWDTDCDSSHSTQIKSSLKVQGYEIVEEMLLKWKKNVDTCFLQKFKQRPSHLKCEWFNLYCTLTLKVPLDDNSVSICTLKSAPHAPTEILECHGCCHTILSKLHPAGNVAWARGAIGVICYTLAFIHTQYTPLIFRRIHPKMKLKTCKCNKI